MSEPKKHATPEGETPEIETHDAYDAYDACDAYDAEAVPAMAPPPGITVQYGFVLSVAALMGMSVWIIATWIQTGLRGPAAHHAKPVLRSAQPVHGAQKVSLASLPRTQPQMAALALQGVSSARTLKQYYARRAYPGAPPIIPHPVAKRRRGEPLRCLSCHKDGGYVPAYKAYTPVVPHPEQSNCTQCHVAQATRTPFRGTRWVRRKPVRLGQSALPGGPPVIPHALQGRTNCLACHAGPAAPKEIRTPHPQRVYCTQCHVPQAGAPSFRARFGLKGLLPTSRSAKPAPRGKAATP